VCWEEVHLAPPGAVAELGALGVTRIMLHRYPSEIPGLRMIGRKNFPEWSPSADFQSTSSFDSTSAHQLFTLLPEELQICYADPDRGASSDLTYVFVRRSGHSFFEQTGGHGHSSRWSEVPFDRVLSSFVLSRLVRTPVADFPSFSVQTIPDHQRHEHTTIDRA
jgi:hypothetical protein